MPSVFFLPFLLFDIKPALFFSFLLCLADFLRSVFSSSRWAASACCDFVPMPVFCS